MAHVPRIMFVCTQMEAGGVQRRATAMAAELNRQGIAARVVFLYRKTHAYADLPFCSSLLPERPRGVLDLALVLRLLLSEIRTFRPTATIGMAHYSSPIASVLAWLMRIPNRLGTQTNPPTSVGLIGRAMDLLCGALGIYTANICASHSIQAEFVNYPRSYQRSLVTVLNGIAHPNQIPLSKSRAREKFGVPADGPIILNCGRLSAQKNQALLIRCIRNVPATLVIAGEGELRGALEDEVERLDLQDRVVLLGEIPPSSMEDLFSIADVFAFPSKYEAFGLAVVEAMRAGLPVVASTHSSMVEIVGNAGSLIDPDNEEEWSKALTRLLNDDALRERHGELSLERARRYTLEAMLSGYIRYATKSAS